MAPVPVLSRPAKVLVSESPFGARRKCPAAQRETLVSSPEEQWGLPAFPEVQRETFVSFPEELSDFACWVDFALVRGAS